MNKLFIFLLVFLLALSNEVRPDVAAGTMVAGGKVVLPQQPSTMGFAGALGQPVIGRSGAGTLWSGLITPDVIGGQSPITAIWLPDNHWGAVGTKVTVPLYLRGTLPIAGVQAFIDFDPNQLTYVGVTKGSLISADPDWIVEANVTSQNQLRVLASANLTLKTVLPNQTKPLALIEFEVQSQATRNSVFPLTFTAITKVAAQSGEAGPLQWSNGKIQVEIDPTLSFATPQLDSFINHLPSVTGIAADGSAGSGLNRVSFFIRRSDGQYWNGFNWSPTATALGTILENRAWTAPTSTYALPNGSQLPDGAYVLSASVFDNLGGTSSSSLSVMVDQTAPSVSFTWPTDRQVAGGLPYLTGLANDNPNGSGIQRVELTLKRHDGTFWSGETWKATNSVLPTTFTASQWSNAIRLPRDAELSPGVYTLTATAFDKANNKATQEIAITIDPIAPPPPTPVPTPVATPKPTPVTPPTPGPTPVPVLGVTVTPNIFSESVDPETLSGVVTLDSPLQRPLSVSLNSSHPRKLRFSEASVTIPAGATSARFSVEAINNELADGAQTATISASAHELVTATTTITITDDEAPTLTLRIAPGYHNRIGENAGANASRGRVLRNSDITRNTPALQVSLSSSSSRVRVPTTVMIPAGAAYVDFAISAVDNRTAEGPLQINLMAQASGLAAGTTVITVTDNEAASNLRLSGTVKTTAELGGVPVPGVTLTLRRGNFILDVQASSTVGTYGFSGLPVGTYTVTPTKENYSFNPATARVVLPQPATVTGAPHANDINFTGLPRASIRGRVTRVDSAGQLTPVPGVVVRAQSLYGGALSALAGRDGSYQITGLGLGSYTVVPVQVGTYYRPNLRSVTLTVMNPISAGVDFVVAGVDHVNPVVQVVEPTATRFTIGATGTLKNLTVAAQASDTGGAGLAVVTASIVRFSNATTTATSGYLNWTVSSPAPVFQTPDNLIGEKLMVLVSGRWRLTDAQALSLVRNLPVGFYGVRVTALDAAGRVTRSPWKRFTVVESTLSEAPVANGNNAAASPITPSPVAISRIKAQVSTSSVQMRFSGSLDPETASEPTRFIVEVNGRRVVVGSAAYNATTHTVTLTLAEETMRVGDTVTVRGSELRNSRGHAVSATGRTTVLP